MKYEGKNLESTQDLFDELGDRVMEEGVQDYAGYAELVDELLREQHDLGLIEDDADTAQLRASLLQRWTELEEQIS